MLNSEDQLYHLRLKLIEESHELFQSRNQSEFLKEAADVLEVLQAMAQHYSVNWSAVEAEQRFRNQTRGGFSKGIFLHTVVDKDTLHDHPSDKTILTPRVITRTSSPSLLEILTQELGNSESCRFASAFCTRSMVNLLVRPIERFLEEGGQLSLLTSVMNNFNNPDDLLHLQHELPGCQIRVFYPEFNVRGNKFFNKPPSFHLKCFLFRKRDGHHALIVGSSNLTLGGLLKNEEWNFYSNSEVNLSFSQGKTDTVYESAEQQFDTYWNQDSVELTPDFIELYRHQWQQANTQKPFFMEPLEPPPQAPLAPRPSQQKALDALEENRRTGLKKSAVIAATGLGKTHLAAFDFKRSGMKKMLFIVHRETVLRQAMEVFRQVLENPEFGKILAGQLAEGERESCYSPETSVFAMIQTLSRPEVLQRFKNDHFDYIVIDEFHHAAADTYQKVLYHFSPRFFLGITATPERMDGRDVLKFCDYNIAYEARLFEAIDQGWLTLFQYFAIHDETDYSQIRWTGMGYDENELEKNLNQDTRVNLIARNLKRFLPSTGKIKALAFCATRGHARYMTHQFNRLGIHAECLLGEDSEESRSLVIQRIQDESNPLKVICSVDILGEGVDIPAISHVLMLRPTLSFTVFLQQLGRGLRKQASKEFLVVLDFVGNYRNSYIAPLVLRGYSSYEEFRGKESQDLSYKLPEGCFVDVDTQVSRIWDQEIRRILTPRNRKEMLLESYSKMRDFLGYSPTLLDFLSNPEACEPQAFLKFFGNWLKVKEACRDLAPEESKWMNTPAEKFLEHLEKELNPNRSYKMVVLLALLEDQSGITEWSVDWIAPRFLAYYLENPKHLSDCTPLAKAKNPANVLISEINTLLKNKPLHFLSNSEDDFFIFDKRSGYFALKPEIHGYWHEKNFRVRVHERVSYALALYFNRKIPPIVLDEPSSESKVVQMTASKKTSSKTTVPFFSTMKMAAGKFRESMQEFDHELISVSDPSEKLSPERHFVVRIEGDSMDGGKNPVHNGDLVLLERLDATRAGSLTAERAIAVEYRDFTGETAYALKQIKKRSTGEYYLHSWNSQYPDSPVDPETLFPIARFIQIIKEEL
ncbi:DEAD/DEAH box helicase family protein [Deltaproteobacteria bacterium TL4]